MLVIPEKPRANRTDDFLSSSLVLFQVKTRDLGGYASTRQFTQAISDACLEYASVKRGDW